MNRGQQGETPDKNCMGKISAWLKARRDRNRIPLPSLHWQSFLLIAANFALLAFFVFDGPVVAAMQNMPAIIRSAGNTLTDIGKSGWILFGSAFMFFEALATSRWSEAGPVADQVLRALDRSLALPDSGLALGHAAPWIKAMDEEARILAASRILTPALRRMVHPRRESGEG